MTALQVTKRIKVYGIVQGVGFRPTVARHAAATGVRGSVCNKGPYVEIIAQGSAEEITAFVDKIAKEPPRRAVILKIDVKERDEGRQEDSSPAIPVYRDFQIVESAKTKGEIFIPPDIAICDECRQELFDPADRRYLHPFINCTCCGPRLTILEGLPYDRERTSMKMFPMCRSCAQEYNDPGSRRYDAQPVCCNECGPQVYWIQTGTAKPPVSCTGTDNRRRGRKETDHAAISRARRVIAGGGIVAVKGIGGFHLCCDATDESAVRRLRTLKRRPVKPFAVMMRDQNTVERECVLSPEQEEILTGHQKPILLLQKRERKNTEENRAVKERNDQNTGTRLCPGIAPGNPTVGVMLPYAPVHLLLFDYDDGIRMPDCLVMTSGNVSGAPICRDDTEALDELGRMCDGILSHDRKIRIRADDSVMDFFDGKPYMIRRSRGYAPLPYMVSGISGSSHSGQDRVLPADVASENSSGQGEVKVLAVGGELKNTFCIGTGNLFYPSSYIGDLADLRSVKALEETVWRYAKLLEVEPQVIACDLHPKYNSVMVAEEMAGKSIPLVRVQHHFAHVVSCMAENDYADPVIGVSMDGTGFGADGTIWGGEILLADYHGFERAGSIRPFIQVGGDVSSREGWRIAVSMLQGIAQTEQGTSDCGSRRSPITDLVTALNLCTEQEGRAVMAMANKGLNAVTSTSAGRLFDAVSAILGICRRSTFEGEASMALEFAAERYEKMHSKELLRGMSGSKKKNEQSVRDERDFQILRTDTIVRDLTRAILRGESTDRLAWIFHRRLADEIVRVCREIRSSHAMKLPGQSKRYDTVALSGGCFQNRLLLRMTKHGLEDSGFRILIHHLVPTNDGGIALGQAVAAAQAVADGKV